MFKKYILVFLILGVCLIAIASETRGKEERQIPVVVSADVSLKTVKRGEAIPLDITVSNGLPSSIYLSTFSLIPNDWNGETCNVSLVDIYRDNKPGSLYLSRPKMEVPKTISGMRSCEVKSGGKLIIRTDARKWKLRDEWLPGKYKVIVRIDKLNIDKYSTLSVLADPVEFEIK